MGTRDRAAALAQIRASSTGGRIAGGLRVEDRLGLLRRVGAAGFAIP